MSTAAPGPQSAAPGDGCSLGVGTSSMQSAVPDAIGSSEAVPSGAAACPLPLDFFLLLQSAAPGVQSADPGAVGSAEAGAPWAPDCFFRVGIFAGLDTFAFFSASRSVSEMKMDSDSGDGMIDGFLICSSETPGGMDCLVQPSLDNASAASLLALGMW